MAIAALVAWALTAALGAGMLASLTARGGLREQRDRQRRGGQESLPPAVLFGHVGLALTGLLLWAGFVAAGRAWLAWAALGCLMPAIGLGISTVTLWTPYPGPAGRAGREDPAGPENPAGPSGPGAGGEAGRAGLPRDLAEVLADEALTGQFVDDTLARLLAAPPPGLRRPRWRPQVLIPAGHGIAALITFLLTVLTVSGPR